MWKTGYCCCKLEAIKLEILVRELEIKMILFKNDFPGLVLNLFFLTF